MNTSPASDLKGISVLVLDDNRQDGLSLEVSLKGHGATVFSVSDVAGAAGVLARHRINVILASIDLADQSCIDLVTAHKKTDPQILMYILTDEDYRDVEALIESVRFVVDDYIRKPVDVQRLIGMILTSLGRPVTGSTSLAVVEPLVTQVKPYFLFRAPAMRHALASISEIARSGQTVLISGETGTGKELVARAIHVLSPRKEGPFIPINCGAIPESLIEGELFGHEKGAFTGASSTRKGKFETAHNGTLFLDEIGDMPHALQVRLLRVLEDRKVFRIGAEKPVSVNVRVIAATRIDLGKAVHDGLFREDLYYRINVLRIHLPPLRERREDIALLASHFIERAFNEMGRIPPFPSFSSETLHLLEQYPWRGNVRELRNIMTRVATLLPADTQRIFPFHIHPHFDDMISEASFPVSSDLKGIAVPYGEGLLHAENRIIQETLRMTNGNRTKAARLLGISIRTLRRRLNKQ